MIATAKNRNRTVLLLLPTKNEMYPLSTAAMTQAQASRHELQSNYKDALILDLDGSLRRFECVEVLGPLGKSLAKRLLNRLMNAWSIDVKLSAAIPYTLQEIKELLVTCIGSPQSADTMELQSGEALARFVASVHASTSISEVLTILNLPKPEDALDIL